jgi:hypothetical protein
MVVVCTQCQTAQDSAELFMVTKLTGENDLVWAQHVNEGYNVYLHKLRRVQKLPAEVCRKCIQSAKQEQ